MNLTQKQRRIIVLGIGLAIIVMGLLKPVFKVPVDSGTLDNIAFILMAVAVYLLFTGRKGQEDESPKRGRDE
ncbi:MAG: hypothetical protein QHH06_02225 [Clostridiales bacterium]|jgi:uncharacterized membrane protein|nr:hypothetical protein [Eubacteriales bacterium]MDH7565289.1 hypothetical protein [Clostridiales bacterium]